MDFWMSIFKGYVGDTYKKYGVFHPKIGGQKVATRGHVPFSFWEQDR